MPLLEVPKLDKTFASNGRTVTALDQLSLSIEEHEFVSIVGPSGCGKSTFLHIVGGFEPATAGELHLNGRPIGPPGPDRGMMFQDLSLFRWLTAIENVAWPLEMKGLAKAERLKKAGEYLDLVHLSRYGDLYPGQLSGGMKQRVALARLFALDPEVMLMDEPFGALDSQTRELLQEELQSIWRRTRKTALFVTHDIDESIYLATRLIVYVAALSALADFDCRSVVGTCGLRRAFRRAGGEPLSRRTRIRDRDGHGCGRRARCGNRAWR